MLNCKQINEQATTYLEGEGSFGYRLSFRIHLMMCVHCRRYIKQLKLAIQTAGLLMRIKPPTAEEVDRIVQQLKARVDSASD